MRFEIQNGTRYAEDELRAVLQPVVDLLVAQKGPRALRRHRSLPVQVHFVYARRSGAEHRLPNTALGDLAGRGYSGSAYFLGWKCTLRVPRESLDAQSLAALWLHECWHLWGVSDHRDYPDAVRWCAIRTISHVVHPHMLEERPAELAPRMSEETKAARREERRKLTIERLEARRVSWARKLARAETALRKIDRSLAGYRRRAA